MTDDRKKATEELNSLDLEKQNMQSHLFMVAEAQKRLQKEGLISPPKLQQRNYFNSLNNLNSNLNNHSVNAQINNKIPILIGGRPIITPLPLQLNPPNSYYPYHNEKINDENKLNNNNDNDNDNNNTTSLDKLQHEIHKLKIQSSEILLAKQK